MNKKEDHAIVTVEVEIELPIKTIERLLEESNGSLERFIIEIASISIMNRMNE